MQEIGLAPPLVLAISLISTRRRMWGRDWRIKLWRVMFWIKKKSKIKTLKDSESLLWNRVEGSINKSRIVSIFLMLDIILILLTIWVVVDRYEIVVLWYWKFVISTCIERFVLIEWEIQNSYYHKSITHPRDLFIYLLKVNLLPRDNSKWAWISSRISHIRDLRTWKKI